MSTVLSLDSEKKSHVSQADYQEFLSDVIMEAAGTAGFNAEQFDALKRDRRALLGQLVISLREFLKDSVHRAQQTVRNYPKFKLRTLEDQVKSLCKRFPKLKPTITMVTNQENADGVFAIPNPRALGSDYYEALQQVFSNIKIARNHQFNNHKCGRIDALHIIHNKKTEEALSIIAQQQQDNDILAFSCQLGSAYAGESQETAITKMAENEFPLNSYMAAIILMTHSQRLLHDTDLSIDAPGDEFLCRGTTKEIAAFSFLEGFLVFSSRKNAASKVFGTASGFIPSQT